MPIPVKFHPFADVFPLMQGTEFEEFVEDVRENGLQEPIEIHEDKILDGRNRYRALLAIAERKLQRGPGWGIYEGMVLEDEDLTPLPDLPWFRRYSVLESGEPLRYVISTAAIWTKASGRWLRRGSRTRGRVGRGPFPKKMQICMIFRVPRPPRR